jgi:SAM-dependent methyltransferase
MVEAAIEAGAEFRPNFLVENCLWDGNRVKGIRGRDRRQNTGSTENALVTIGADGRNSTLARAVGAPSYEETPPLTCWYFSYWSGVPTEGFEWYMRTNRVIFSFLTNDNLFAVFIGWPIGEFNSVRADIEGQFMLVVDSIPGFADRVRSGHREERFYGTADVPNFLRRPFGPGWALVGDAGCQKDPMMAHGICDAFRDAEFLSTAIHEGLAGQCALDEALIRYERRRNEATIGEYRENIAAAHFTPVSPELVQLRLALRGNQEDTNRFVMALEGWISHEEFFNPDNLQRILAKAGSRTVALEHPVVSYLPCRSISKQIENSPSTDYVFDRTDENAAANRFGGLSALYDKQTTRHLERLGADEGWGCLEVGAGGGSIASWLCERVGKNGHVVATDIEPRFLEALSYPNLEVRRHDIRRDGLPKHKFDLAHARLLLVHLPERELALQRIIESLKPGGWILIEEVDDFSIVPDSSVNPAEEELQVRRAFQHVLAASGVELRFGRLLPQKLIACGLTNVGAEATVSIWKGRSEGTGLLQLTCRQLRDPILRSGLISESQFEAEMRRVDEEDFLMPSPMMWSVWGQVP